MVFKFRMLNLLAHRFSPRITAGTASHRFRGNSLCTTAESPELPRWLKFSDTPTPPDADSDDNFVIPSLANWVETHILTSKPKLPAQSSKKNSIDHVEAVFALLKKRYSSPELVAEALHGRGFQPSSDWFRRFSGDSATIGSLLWGLSNGQKLKQVIGILPKYTT